ncbi:hypothetical protein FGG08_004515 [Glutinoglossum americanum]|uniref:Phosphate transporter n=1 Tax=Glutinoglossum americanum TaxID=1670608 RepID=A0A9P8I274_9PEZI|nr:hypothetical protein FGG08_004515 [Glutinoglossum americanum]
MVFHQYDYILAIGFIFAFLDAWGIGANDVANSFATSVSSRALTLPQAMMIASVFEFAGAVLAGSRVSDTVRSKIVTVKKFEKDPGVLMLGMACALIGSSTWVVAATKFGLPVSTTHSIVGGIIGAGIATYGTSGINWSWKTKGVSQILASWVIAPAIAGAFAACLFLFTKYVVLKRKNSLKWGLYLVPAYFALTSGVLTMLVVWKGAPSLKLDGWKAGQTLGCIFGVAGGMALLVAVFLVPFFYRKLEKEDWTLRWYDLFQGPLLLKRGPVPEMPEDAEIVQDYYRGRATREELEAANISAKGIEDLEHAKAVKETEAKGTGLDILGAVEPGRSPSPEETRGGDTLEAAEKASTGPWYKPRNFVRIVHAAFLHGVRKDVIELQKKDSKVSGKRTRVLDMLARAAHYPNKTEHAAIVIGLWTYGYNIMKNLGNRMTLMSPSRGFSMELGSAVTVVMASRLGIPISTTQCIVGAIVGVGLCNGDLRSLNWQMVAWCYAGWVITLPITGLISGILMGIIINAPRIGFKG